MKPRNNTIAIRNNLGYLTVNILGVLEITFNYCHNHNVLIWEPNNSNLKFDLLSLNNIVINIDLKNVVLVRVWWRLDVVLVAEAGLVVLLVHSSLVWHLGCYCVSA